MNSDRDDVATVAVSNGAGEARQYRVQFRDAAGNAWQRYAIFKQPKSANSCAEQLRDRGIPVRIVHYAIVPAAG